MKLLKLAIISAIVFALLLTAMSLLIPSTVRISRAVDINANTNNIFPYIKNVGKWREWNMYVDSFHNLKNTAPLQLLSDDMNIDITNISDSSITAIWQKNGGQQFQSVYRIIPNNNATTIQWYFDFKLKWYPWEKFSSIIYDNQFGPVMEQSLFKLKVLAEGNQ